MTLLVRDEEDIVRQNIAFHLDRGVDFVIAMDNLSVDRTPAILREFEQQGVLRYIHQPGDDYSQYRWVTEMACMAAELGADWVINNDADEFWWPEGGDLKRALSEMPPSCIAAAAQRSNFLPRAMAKGETFSEVMTVRDLHSTNALGKPLPGKVCHRAFADIQVDQGNHGIHRNGEPVAATAAAITIMHFPMRSYKQFANKIRNGATSLARNPRLQGVSLSWHRLHDLLLVGELERHFCDALLDDAAIDDGIRRGLFVRDERLKLALAEIGAR